MKNIKKRRRICITLILLCIVINIILWGYPLVYENQCKNRVDSELEQQLTDNVKSANFRILVKITQTAENMSADSFGEIGCGVIFEYKDGYYYALTAAHVIDGETEFETDISIDSDEDEVISKEFYMVPYGTLTYDQASAESDTHISLEEYYSQFVPVDVEYVSAINDLAIIRFQSDNEYGSLTFADEDPLKGERIVVFGEDTETGSITNYGKIISDKYEAFDTSDGRPTDQILKHNAYEKHGYSGGAVLNKQMKIVGINIGGGTNVFGKFRYGVMIPVNIIKETVAEWKEQ